MDSRQSFAKIGDNRGAPRIWLEGKYLSAYGFDKGCAISASFEDGKITIRPADDGSRTVVGRRGSSIIDINSSEIASSFYDDTKVHVEVSHGLITISRSEADRTGRRARNKKAGSIFSGGGLMDKAVLMAGFLTVFGVDSNPAFADVWQANHTGTMVNSCVSDALAEADRLEEVEMLTMGIPCEPFSQSRRDGIATGDHDLADMTMWAGAFIHKLNPRTVVIEQGHKYLESDIGKAFVRMLRRMDYNVDHRIVSGLDGNELTIRKRTVIVARTGADVVFPPDLERTRTMADILHNPEDPRCEWFTKETKPWLFDHWDRQTAKGNGFASQQITGDTEAVQAITKRYFAQQGDNPVVKDEREGREGWFRWLTIDEVKLIMGLPEDYDLGTAKTTAGEVMGQGVLVNTFARIIQANA
jgi:DNA (cytosine-5)-methyltransferase 1